MWRPSPAVSREIILLRIPREPRAENHKAVKIPITAEAYPYANPVSRQAIGITNEANGAAGDAAYAVLYSGAAPLADDVILMGESVYSLRSIAPYSPVQLVIADTGMTEAQYLEERGVSYG